MLTASDGVRELAVLGSPIAHSKSPDLHGAAYHVLELPWRYGRAQVAADELAGFVHSRSDAWRGLSLTMPLKQSVLPLVATLDETARITGAANTILFDQENGERVLHGFNTDVSGIVRALAAAGTSSARSTRPNRIRARETAAAGSSRSAATEKCAALPARRDRAGLALQPRSG